MTVEQIVRKIFKETKLPRLEIELILAYTLKKTREFLFTYPENQLTHVQITRFESLVARRMKGEPIAYLTGNKEFYGLDFLVNKNVLIPRPETELMVEAALPHITHNIEQVTIVDIGTGSGCVVITLAKLLRSQLTSYNLQLYAADISKPALQIARQNARRHHVLNKIKFYHGNLLEPLINNRNWKLEIGNWKLIILANLPYLTPAQIKNSPTIKFEPKLALSAGADGLKYYRQLFQQLKLLHVTCYVLCEIDPSQKNKIKQLVRRELPEAIIQYKKDLRGNNRLVIIKI